MNYKYGLQTINPIFERIRRAIEYGKNSIVLIAENRGVAEIYFENLNMVLERLGYMEKIESISICRNVGDFSVVDKNKENTLVILCGQWYRNEMFLHRGVLEVLRELMSESLPEIPSKLFNPFTNKVEYTYDWV